MIVRLSNLFLSLILPLGMSSCKNSESGNMNLLYEMQTVQAHPRILLLKGEEEQIKKTITIDSTWNAIHQVIIHESNNIIEKPLVVYELEGRRLLKVSREARKRLFFLSYAYRMTGEAKYLNRAEKELLNVTGFKDWNPSHFLDVAEMMWGVSIGYDWLYDDLQESSKKKIEDAIIKLGIEPSFEKDYNFWLQEDTNWNQVCNASLAFGAIAIYEIDKELAQKIINRSITSTQLAMKGYEPDGTYPEGYIYWSYGTTFNAYLIDALEKAFANDFGLLKNNGFLKSAGYLANMVGPSGLNFNYSDGESLSMLNPVMFWYANRQKNYSLLISEKLLLKRESDLPWQKDLPAVMIWGAKEELEIQEPHELIWVGQGKNPVALMRNSWSQDAIYVGLKGGAPNINHGHMDIGSFVMDALGERWAMDFGSQSYFTLESKGVDLWQSGQESQRWNVFRYNNLAHNTLAFNSEFQLVDGYAPISNFTTNPFFLSATTELTSVYSNHVTRAFRGVAIINGQYVAVRDEIELKNLPRTIRWTMLTSATVKITGKNTAELIQNNKRLILKIEDPSRVELTTWSTQSTHDYDEPNPGTTFVGFELKTNHDKKVEITVLLIPINDRETHFKKVPSLDKWKDHK